MSPKVKRRLAAIMAGIMAGILLLSLFLSLLTPALAAKSSNELANEMYETEQEANKYEQQAAAFREQAAARREEALAAVEKKQIIDQAIQKVEEEVDEIRVELQQLNLNIAEKQTELDEALDAEAEMAARYKTRLRAMEESGEQTYWSVLFQATSVSDLLDRLNMISEISQADQLMQAQLAAARALVEQEQEELETARAALAEKQQELEDKQVQLAELRVTMDEWIIELVADNELLVIAQLAAEEQEAVLREESLALLADYNAARQKEQGTSGSSSASAGASGYLYPLPSGTGWVTDAYGMRWHPIAGEYRFHYGVDLAADAGVAVYATKSGTVVKVATEYYNGNCVMIQHDDGSASQYAHLSSFAVSNGDYVSQGSIIGYVGSSGYSTGPHLHFEIYINGATVNPMEYVSIY